MSTFSLKATPIDPAIAGVGETRFVEETGITSVRIGHLQVPTDRSGQMWLSFTPHDPDRFRSAVDVLEGRVARSEIADRIVLIGDQRAGQFDLLSRAPAASTDWSSHRGWNRRQHRLPDTIQLHGHG